jgi:hypothetical protein
MAAQEYRITWRHEVTIIADSPEDARMVWESRVNLGELDRCAKLNKILSHDFVEEVSFEDENYNDVSK